MTSEQITAAAEIHNILLHGADIDGMKPATRSYYEKYIEDDEVSECVRAFARAENCEVVLINSDIFMAPCSTNSMLGYTNTQMKREFGLKMGRASSSDYKLLLFSVLVLIMEFFDAPGGCKVQDYMRLNDFIGRVEKYLEYGAETGRDEEIPEFELAILKDKYSELLNSFRGKLPSESGSPESVQSFFLKAVLFLKSQGLVEYREDDRTIIPTRKLECRVRYLLSEGRLKEYKAIFDVPGSDAGVEDSN